MSKIINDSIHGHVVVPEIVVKMIDTPQFQRLRRLKQTGASHYIYPDATHTRFSHSIGVCHLARILGEKLQKSNSEITSKDILCLQIAAACHDLGHGPESHLYERFVKKIHPEENYSHEEMSLKMLDHLIQSNNLSQIINEYLNEQDWIFVKELIFGPLENLNKTGNGKQFDQWNYKGRPEEKSFLFEVVANKKNGMDVDKFDYMRRDAQYFGMGHMFDLDRYMHYCKVIVDENHRKTIALPFKEKKLVRDLFTDRSIMHKRCYQHPKVKIIETMLIDAWTLADEHIQIFGANGQRYSLSTAWKDVTAFEKLTDISERIECSEKENLMEAKNLLTRIHKRDLYKILDYVDTQDDKLKKLLEKFLDEQNVPNQQIGIIQTKIPSGEGNDDPHMTYFENGLIFPDTKTKFENPSVTNYIFVCKINDTEIIENSKRIISNFIGLYKLK